jgi:hypothetical protein
MTFDELDDLLATRGDAAGSRTSPTSSMRRCPSPSHDDNTPSLSVKEDAGRILLHDFGGCETASVLEALGLTFADLSPCRTQARRDDPGSIPAALRRVLARERRHADRTDLYRVSDLRRVVQAYGDEVSRRAATLGADHPAVWTLVEEEARARRDVALLDTRLDKAITWWRGRARYE